MMGRDPPRRGSHGELRHGLLRGVERIAMLGQRPVKFCRRLLLCAGLLYALRHTPHHESFRIDQSIFESELGLN